MKSYRITKAKIDEAYRGVNAVMKTRAVCDYSVDMEERTITVGQVKDGVLHNAISMTTLNMLNLIIDVRYIKCEENKWVVHFEYYNRN